MITRKQKEEKVRELATSLRAADSIFITDYRGLTVKEISKVRNNLREKNCDYLVVKNTLTMLAVKEVGFAGMETYLEGPTAITISSNDPIDIAKTLLKWVKELDNLDIKAGVLGGKLLTPEQVKALGNIPSKNVLLVLVCSTFQAPITGLARALKGNINNLVYALEAVRKQKEAS